MPDPTSRPNPTPRPRRLTILAAGVLLVALALVVVAAIGAAALLLQLRLRPGASPLPIQGQLWLNGIGVIFALAAVFSDFAHLNPAFMLISALIAVVAFAISGFIVLSALRKRQ